VKKDQGIIITRGYYCYLKREEDVMPAIDSSGQDPGFRATSNKSLGSHRVDHIRWEGEGVYRIHYLSHGPCPHGLWVEKVDRAKVLAIREFYRAVDVTFDTRKPG